MKINDVETVDIYSIPSCPFCVKAKELLDEHGVKYNEYILSKDGGIGREDVQQRVNDLGHSDIVVQTVPQIMYKSKSDGEWHYIGGFNELNNSIELNN